MAGPTLHKVAYVLKRYPRYSETFVVNEILAHQIAGQPIEIFALRPVEESHFQDILGQVQAPVTRFADAMKSSETLWSLMREVRATIPGAWPALGNIMGGLKARDVGQAIMVALACQRKGVVHLHAHFGTSATTVARLAAAISGITYSFTAHAKDIYFAYDDSGDLDVKLREAFRVITVSDYNVGHLRKRFGRHADSVLRIYNGLDLDRFAYTPPPADAQQILAVGRLIEKKGFHILIEAIRLLRGQDRAISCQIIGAGDELANLEAQVASSNLGGVVHLVGPRPQADVIRAMREAAVLACPCVVGRDGNRDGLPTVLIEAMALGTPCVATDVTGIPEIVRNEATGLCVAESDPQSLAAALARMLDDHALRVRLSSAARALIEREFDVRVNAARLRSVFADAIASQQELERGAA